MRYNSAEQWNNATNKNILLFGMSGLGKTYLSNLLRKEGDWFHYSIDYRIGTRYMGDHIVDNVKSEAMKNPFLANLLKMISNLKLLSTTNSSIACFIPGAYLKL